jgi:hypothetical protein
MRLALIRPDRRSVPSTARPDIMPPSSDLYDVIYFPGPSSGPPPASDISSVSVACIQLWHPTPNRTDPSVAMIRSTSLVTSHCLGVWNSPMSPTKFFTCLGKAWNAYPMADTYGTSCVICVMCCVCMGVCSMISIYRCRWVTIATCVIACLSGSAPSLPWVTKRSRLMFCAWCRIHLLFVWCQSSCALVSRYHSCFVWCSTYQFPRGCSMLPSCANNSVIACFHAFHAVGLCCTGHSHMLLRVLSLSALSAPKVPSFCRCCLRYLM